MRNRKSVLPTKYGRDEAPVRFFAFPHGGGAHTAYRTWAAKLPGYVQLISYTLPGRGALHSAPPFAEWPEIIDAVSTLVRNELDIAPAGTFYVFFGHSFGALLAFEVARAFHAQNQPLPACLFLSAHRAAHLRSHHRGERQRHSLAHEQFVDMVREWGFVSDEVLANEDVLKFILPPLRSDLRLDELHEFVPGKPLPVHCFVYGGETDHSVLRNELEAWRALFCSRYRFESKLYPGGHFYAVDCENELLANISRHLAEVLETDKLFAARDGRAKVIAGR